VDQPDGTTEMQFVVVMNDEEQHSIWAADRAIPDGWHDTGFRGTRQECLDQIAKVWTDITPRSVREARRSE
jgi:MbtH protein